MKRWGSVLVFRPGTDPNVAQERLAALQDILDPNYFGGELRRVGDTHVWVSSDRPTINEFNDEHGGPVWYIP